MIIVIIMNMSMIRIRIMIIIIIIIILLGGPRSLCRLEAIPASIGSILSNQN